MKKDFTRYVMTILLACSLLLSGCGSISIPGTGFGDNLPTDSRQSGEETESKQEEQNENLSRTGSMNKEQKNAEEKADTGSTNQSGEDTSENVTANSTVAAGSEESSSSAEVGAVRKESFDWLKGYVPVSTEPITVRRWNVTTSESFERCCEIYEKYTGIPVSVEHYDWNDYQKMLDESFENGTDPGIVRMHPYFAARYIDQGNLIDLNDLLSQHSLYLKPEDVNKESLSTFIRDDKLYGIISNMSCSALWYNKKLFDEKQLPYPDEAWTWEDVAEAAAALNDPDNGKYGISLSYNETEEGYYNIIAAYNGTVINEDRTRSGFDQEGTLKAMELTADLIRRGMPPVEVMEQNDQMSLLCEGKTAMAVLGSWRVRDLENNEYALNNLDCTILPYAGEEMTRGGIRTISGYSIPSGCERAEDYWHFIELMYCYDRIAGSDTGFAIPIDPSAVKTIDAREYPFAVREAYLDLLYADAEFGDAEAAGTETAASGATGQNAAATGQAVKTRILNIPSSLDTAAWVSEVGKYMKKAWNDPDQMEEYCRELAGVINHKLDIENHVPDTQAPVITLEKDSFTISDADGAPDYLEGVKATDDYDGDITDKISADDSEVKYGTPGTYQVKYSVTDDAGNTGEAAAPVVIRDQTAPELQLAKTEFRIQVGDDKPDYLSYASSRDSNDGDLTGQIKVDDSDADYGSAGSYTIRFSVADAAGNEASKEASLVIEKKPEPAPVVQEPEEDVDSSYRYVINANSGIFHDPDCGSVARMKEYNKIYTSESKQELIDQGYDPCDNCRP